MPAFRVVLERRAFDQLRRLERAEREEALRLIDALGGDPSPNQLTKRTFELSPDSQVIFFRGDLVWLSYVRLRDETVVVRAVMVRRGEA